MSWVKESIAILNSCRSLDLLIKAWVAFASRISPLRSLPLLKYNVSLENKKTGKRFSFWCVAPLIIKRKSKQEIIKFEKIGADIGLLFQVADDLIDNKGSLLEAGKKTGKDKIKGKATLISLLGHKNTIKYANKLIIKINNKLKKYGSKSKNLSETLDYILNRNK